MVSSGKWYPILFGIVLNTCPYGKVRKALREPIWNKENNESFLRTYTPTQSDSEAERRHGLADVIVNWAMRYGKPSIGDRIQVMKNQVCDRILLFPLYPQYACRDDRHRQRQGFRKADDHALANWCCAPYPDYHSDPTYIEALANSVTRHLATLDWQPEKDPCVFPRHPAFLYSEKGDPYYGYCIETGSTSCAKSSDFPKTGS